jgi:hypothetical protein
VKLDQLAFAVCGHEAKSVHPEAIHVAVSADYAVSRHGPEECMQRAGLLTEEVPCRIMGGRGLGYLPIALRLDAVNEVWEQDCVLDEENRDVVADEVCKR